MSWFFISLLGPFFWSISNHVDKFLLEKHFKGLGKEALVLYSTLFGFVVLPVAYFFSPKVLSIEFTDITILICAGCLSSLSIYLYLYALENEEASVVVPFFQTVPVFGFILGFFILGEILSNIQIIGSLIIIAGSVTLALDVGDFKKLRFKKEVAFLMLGSSLFFATYEILFKFAALSGGFWIATFWQYVGLLIFGVILFLSSKKYRLDFLYLIRRHNWKLFSANVVNESLTIFGNSFYNFALLLVPAALVMTVSGYQPMLVFIEGIILTLFFPKIVEEKIKIVHLAHKFLSIVIIILGTTLIAQTF